MLIRYVRNLIFIATCLYANPYCHAMINTGRINVPNDGVGKCSLFKNLTKKSLDPFEMLIKNNLHLLNYNELYAAILCWGSYEQLMALKAVALGTKASQAIKTVEHYIRHGLITASRNNNKTLAIDLLEHGACPHITNIRGETPLEIAASCGFKTMVTILLSTDHTCKCSVKKEPTPFWRILSGACSILFPSTKSIEIPEHEKLLSKALRSIDRQKILQLPLEEIKRFKHIVCDIILAAATKKTLYENYSIGRELGVLLSWSKSIHRMMTWPDLSDFSLAKEQNYASRMLGLLFACPAYTEDFEKFLRRNSITELEMLSLDAIKKALVFRNYKNFSILFQKLPVGSCDKQDSAKIILDNVHTALDHHASICPSFTKQIRTLEFHERCKKMQLYTLYQLCKKPCSTNIRFVFKK